MKSLIDYTVDYQKLIIEFDLVPLHQKLTKCSRIKQAYKLLCAE